MAKPKKTPRSRRRRGSRPPAAPPAAAAPTRPIARPVPMETPGAAPTLDQPRERTSARTITLDFSYVMKDVRRVAVLATVVLIAIVVLSFFLP